MTVLPAVQVNGRSLASSFPHLDSAAGWLVELGWSRLGLRLWFWSKQGGGDGDLRGEAVGFQSGYSP